MHVLFDGAEPPRGVQLEEGGGLHKKQDSSCGVYHIQQLAAVHI